MTDKYWNWIFSISTQVHVYKVQLQFWLSQIYVQLVYSHISEIWKFWLGNLLYISRVITQDFLSTNVAVSWNLCGTCFPLCRRVFTVSEPTFESNYWHNFPTMLCIYHASHCSPCHRLSKSMYYFHLIAMVTIQGLWLAKYGSQYLSNPKCRVRAKTKFGFFFPLPYPKCYHLLGR